MKIVFLESEITSVPAKGRGRPYEKAVVKYTYNGEPRQQTLVSFKNPNVFKTVKELKAGDEVDVQYVKNEEGFSEWTAITLPDAAAPSDKPSPSAGTNRVVGSNYETKEERASRQVLIVKQSSLAQAVAFNGGRDANVEKILEVAQEFTDWVLDNPVE